MYNPPIELLLDTESRIRRRFSSYDAYIDLDCCIWVGLEKACRTFKKRRGRSFYSYAYALCRNEFKNAYHNRYRVAKNAGEIPPGLIGSSRMDGWFEYDVDMVEVHENIELRFGNVFSELREKDLLPVFLKLESRSEAAKRNGMSAENIRQQIKKYTQILAKEMGIIYERRHDETLRGVEKRKGRGRQGVWQYHRPVEAVGGTDPAIERGDHSAGRNAQVASRT